MLKYLRKSYHRIILEGFLEAYAEKINGSALDIGSGSRRYDALFAAKITAIDCIPNARRNILYADVERRLDFTNEAFDAVVCIEVLQYIENWRGLLQEIDRVLKPGGVAIISLAFMYHECGDKVRLTAPYLGGVLANIFEHIEQKKVGNAQTIIWDVLRKKALSRRLLMARIFALLSCLPILLYLLAGPGKRIDEKYYSGLFYFVRKRGG